MRSPSRRLELVLAGVGPDEGRLRGYARAQGLADVVQFAGWTEYENIPALLGRADALVLPSHSDPFPVAVIEAMAAGLPVLGSDACGSVRERVVNGENGFTHRAGDAATLADHMERIAADPADRSMLGGHALATSNVWGVDRCVTVLRDTLSRLAAPVAHSARIVSCLP